MFNSILEGGMEGLMLLTVVQFVNAVRTKNNVWETYVDDIREALSTLIEVSPKEKPYIIADAMYSIVALFRESGQVIENKDYIVRVCASLLSGLTDEDIEESVNLCIRILHLRYDDSGISDGLEDSSISDEVNFVRGAEDSLYIIVIIRILLAIILRDQFRHSTLEDVQYLVNRVSGLSADIENNLYKFYGTLR